jgi:hypothetical protein
MGLSSFYRELFWLYKMQHELLEALPTTACRKAGFDRRQ